MDINLLSNNKEINHFNFLLKYTKNADKLVIVSPFLASDIGKMFVDMPTIKSIELYTNIDGYNMTVSNLESILNLYDYCFKNNVTVKVKYNNQLHGKVYLLYKKEQERGCIITSGNFTENGLKKNHEYGIYLNDLTIQKELAGQIQSLAFSDLSFEDVKYLIKLSDVFLEKNPVIKLPIFKIGNYINIKPSKNKTSKCRYFIKPLGTSAGPIMPGYTIIEDRIIGLPEKSSSISQDDIFICHGVGTGKILGYCTVLEDEPTKSTAFEGDRWNWKYPTSCISKQFSSHWWDYDLKTFELVKEFNEIKKPEEHVTAKGTDTLGSIKWGIPIVEVTKEFAHFIIDKIPTVEEE